MSPSSGCQLWDEHVLYLIWRISLNEPLDARRLMEAPCRVIERVLPCGRFADIIWLKHRAQILLFKHRKNSYSMFLYFHLLSTIFYIKHNEEVVIASSTAKVESAVLLAPGSPAGIPWGRWARKRSKFNTTQLCECLLSLNAISSFLLLPSWWTVLKLDIHGKRPDTFTAH